MNPSFKVSMVGPSRVGKTTLLTAILSDAEEMLAGSPVSVTMDEPTRNRVRRQKIELRRAIEAGEFDAAALGGTEAHFFYRVALRAVGDEDVEIPFSILDYPGKWLDSEFRSTRPEVAAQWPDCERHITQSVMLLVPIDAAVLMEAVTPAQRSAVADLLAFEDVEAMARTWAQGRNLEEHRDEPAVLVLAPLKCEKYFADNGGRRNDQGLLRAKVRDKYARLLHILRSEAADRPIRVIYAPIDTYGCVELMEAEWRPIEGEPGQLDFRGHYRFRNTNPRIAVKAAGTVMQELCRCIIAGRDQVEQSAVDHGRRRHRELLERKAEDKGFWGTLGYYLGGEAWENRGLRHDFIRRVDVAQRRQEQLRAALEKLAATPSDARVEEW